MAATLAPTTTTAPASLTNDDLHRLKAAVAALPDEDRPQQLTPDECLLRAQLAERALAEGDADLARRVLQQYGAMRVTLCTNQPILGGRAVLPAGAESFVDRNVAMRWLQAGIATTDDPQALGHLRALGLERVRFPRGGNCSLGQVVPGGVAWVNVDEARQLIWREQAEPVV